MLKLLGAKVEEAFKKACCGEMKKPGNTAAGSGAGTVTGKDNDKLSRGSGAGTVTGKTDKAPGAVTGKTDKAPGAVTGKTDSKPAGGDMKKFARAAAVCKGAFRADGMVAGGTTLNIAKTEMSCERVWNELGGEDEKDGATGMLKLLGAKVEEAFKKACCGEMKKPGNTAAGSGAGTVTGKDNDKLSRGSGAGTGTGKTDDKGPGAGTGKTDDKGPGAGTGKTD